MLPTIIYRHQRENLKKCSLRGLEAREDLLFYSYPKEALPDLTGYVLLSFEGPPLSIADQDYGLVLLDGTWRYAEKMAASIYKRGPVQIRSLPSHFQTAYPRRQEDCSEPDRGLASVEALYIAYLLMGRDPAGLLDHYHWQELFLKKNHLT